MDETYRRTIAPIIRVDEDSETRWPRNQKYGEAEYWTALGNACKELCKVPFVEKTVIVNRIHAGRMLDFEDADHNATLAGYLHISLAMHCWVDAEPKTYAYCKANVGQVVVFVNLAFERNCVYSLIHASFQAQTTIPEPVFPHYMLYEKKASPLVFTPTAPQEQPRDTDIKNIIIKSQALMINLLVKEVAAGLTTLPSSLQDTHSKLYELHKQVAPLLQSHFPECDIDTEDMRTALRLQVAQEDMRPPHTCETCGQYREVQAEGINDHGHFFHAPCLEVHFQQVTRLEESLKCPIHNCPHSLPELLLDHFPPYKERYSHWKTQHLAYSTHANNRNICHHCRSNFPAERLCAVDQHRLCSECGMKTWNNRACIVCHKPLSHEVMVFLQGFLRTSTSLR